MQTVVQVISYSNESLRVQITNDYRKLEDDFNIIVGASKKPGRPHGWAKLYSSRGAGFGVMNVTWDANTCTLTGRVVNRGKGRPNDIVGDFTSYLLARHRGKIRVIQVFQV